MIAAPPDRRKYGPAAHLSRVVPGMTRLGLAQMFARRGYARGAEIGVADGRYSLALCQQIPGLSLLCVDPWQPYRGNRRGGLQAQHDANYALAQARLAQYGARLVRAMSVAAAGDVSDGSLDFVYIDGNHARDYVLADLTAWAPKVRAGGVVAGHDFYDFAGAGVVEAVLAFTAAHGIEDWHLCDEREPSFWWDVRG